MTTDNGLVKRLRDPYYTTTGVSIERDVLGMAADKLESTSAERDSARALATRLAEALGNAIPYVPLCTGVERDGRNVLVDYETQSKEWKR